MTRYVGTVLGMVFLAQGATAQFIQQGSILYGWDAVQPGAFEGTSVAISADGNTAIVGGVLWDGQTGAAWLFTRSGGVWSQQGSTLIGTGAVPGGVGLGTSVAIAADGNTAMVGESWDNNFVGAAWVYTRNEGVWSQQGSKLFGSDAVEAYTQDSSVAISADGNTVIVGGGGDDAEIGAAWVYTRNGSVWTQEGNKLVGTGALGKAEQGRSVAISADGNTAIVGGPHDDPLGDYGSLGFRSGGAVWVYTRSGGVWAQQGGKLVGTDAVYAAQGQSVAISANGNTAIVGGPYNASGNGGAAWVYTRSGGVWTQQGSELLLTDPYSDGPSSNFGYSVAISADGTTVIVGAPNANGAWVFSASSYAAWVPVASHSSGKNNSQWRSDLGLLNPGTVWVNVLFEFFGRGGVVSNRIYVPVGVQSILNDVVGQLGASGSGAIEVLSDQPLKITARSYNQVPSEASCDPNGTQGQDYPAVVASNGLAAGQSAYLAELAENASYRCNIGLVNVGSDSATGLVELFNGAGTKLTDYPVNLNPGDWKQETQPFLSKANQTAMDRGYAKITVQTGSGVFAFASVIDNITNDPTTVAMQESGSGLVVWVPVASRTSGLDNSEWRSDLGLLNPGTVTASVQIQFYGTSVAVPTPLIAVPAGAQLILPDVVGEFGGSGSGALEVTSTQPLQVTARTYNQVSSTANCYADGTEGQDYPAVVAGDGLSAGQGAYLAGLTENASYRCNIGVVNTGAATATVLVALFDSTGNNLANYTVSLAAGQWLQATQPFLNHAHQTAMDRGYAKITVQTGSGVFAFASVIDNITNDPTTVTMQR